MSPKTYFLGYGENLPNFMGGGTFSRALFPVTFLNTENKEIPFR